VNIDVNATAVFGIDLTLKFDPSSVKIREISGGGFLDRDGQIVSVVQKIDTESGTAQISLERPPGAAATSGAGTLITLVLEPGSRKGESLLRVTDLRVRDARQASQAGAPAEVRVVVP
jgi:hypothetical protein